MLNTYFLYFNKHINYVKMSNIIINKINRVLILLLFIPLSNQVFCAQQSNEDQGLVNVYANAYDKANNYNDKRNSRESTPTFFESEEDDDDNVQNKKRNSKEAILVVNKSNNSSTEEQNHKSKGVDDSNAGLLSRKEDQYSIDDLVEKGNDYFSQGDYSQCLRVFKTIQKKARKSKDQEKYAYASVRIANTYQVTSRFDKAFRSYQQSEVLLPKLKDPGLIRESYSNMFLCQKKANQYSAIAKTIAFFIKIYIINFIVQMLRGIIKCMARTCLDYILRNNETVVITEESQADILSSNFKFKGHAEEIFLHTSLFIITWSIFKINNA